MLGHISTVALLGACVAAQEFGGAIFAAMTAPPSGLDGRGISPMPTAPPAGQLFDKRQRFFGSDYCGSYTSGQYDGPVTCNLGACAIETERHRVGCCLRSTAVSGTASLSGCRFPTSCIPSASASNLAASARRDPNLVICTYANQPYCNDYIFNDPALTGYTQLGCGPDPGTVTVTRDGSLPVGQFSASTSSSLRIGSSSSRTGGYSSGLPAASTGASGATTTNTGVDAEPSDGNYGSGTSGEASGTGSSSVASTSATATSISASNAARRDAQSGSPLANIVIAFLAFFL